MSRDPIINALRQQARNIAAFVVIDGHAISPEQTLYWKAADEIERLNMQQARLASDESDLTGSLE